jgi:hypothetical protein
MTHSLWSGDLGDGIGKAARRQIRRSACAEPADLAALMVYQWYGRIVVLYLLLSSKAFYDHLAMRFPRTHK